MIFTVLFNMSLFFYFSGAILYQLSWFLHFRVGQRWGVISLISVTILQLAILIARLIEFGYPFYSLREFIMIYPWALAVSLLVIEWRFGYTLLGVMISPLGALLTLFSILLPEAHSQLLPILQSPVLMVHVSLFMLAYATLTTAFAAAISYLLQENALKKKKLGWRLPPLKIMDQLGSHLNFVGIILIMVAIPLGSYWSKSVWGTAWIWEPKQIMSLVTLTIYGGYFFMRYVVHWPGRRLAWLTILGFISILVTFFGAEFIAANGVHSFLY